MVLMSIGGAGETVAQPLVELRGLGKTFGTYRALEQVSLQIREGEFFALLGPSGCGKTTLMRILAGFEDASEGQVLFQGQDIRGVPPNRRPFNMMFQSYALFPHMSVADNIAFGLRRAGLPRAEVAQRVDDMLTMVQLTPLARRKPDSLSGGQRQRVALARALACRPRLLLLDEPMGALDKKLRQETQLELVNLQKTLGLTFVIVTHDQEEAMTVASRIAVMQAGRLVQVDTPVAIYESPSNRFVADFIGEVNLIEARVGQLGTGTLSLASGLTNGTLVAKASLACERDAKVWLALRPEKIMASATKPEMAENAVPGTVEDVVYLGNLSTYRVRLADGSILRSQSTNVSHGSSQRLVTGSQIWLSWAADAGTVLDQ